MCAARLNLLDPVWAICHQMCPAKMEFETQLESSTPVSGSLLIPPWKWLHRELNVLRQPPTGQRDSRSKQHSRVACVWLTLRPAAPQTHPHTRTRERDRIWYRRSRGDKMRRQQQRHPAVVVNTRSPRCSPGRDRGDIYSRAARAVSASSNVRVQSTVLKKNPLFWVFLKTVEIFQ